MSDEVWRKVEALLGRPVGKRVRTFLEADDPLIEMVLVGARDALRDLVKRVRDVEPHFEGLSDAPGDSRVAPSIRRTGRGRPLRSEGYEQARGRLRTSYLVKRVAVAPSILRFRRDVLRGRKLSQAQARRWLASPAPRFLSQEAFRVLGIPITAHHSRLVGVRGTPRQEGKWFIGEEHVSLEISWRGSRLAREFGYQWRHAEGSEPPSRSKFPVLTEAGTVARLSGFPDSVFAALQSVSQEVAKGTRWPEFDSALFVLTGSPPNDTGIRFKLQPEWTSHLAEDAIVLTVDSWVSPETVAHTFRELQKVVLDGRSRAHKRSLEIVKLAVELMPPGGAPPSPEALFEGWNRRFPKKAYVDCWRFRSHYKEAFTKLLRPGHITLEKQRRRERGEP